MESLFPALVAVAAITLTYFLCIRPMRRGRCGMMPQHQAGDSGEQRDAEIARLRAEVDELRRSQESSQAPDGEAQDGAGQSRAR